MSRVGDGELKRAIFAALEQGPGTLIEIATISGMRYGSVRARVSQLADAGAIKRTKRIMRPHERSRSQPIYELAR